MLNIFRRPGLSFQLLTSSFFLTEKPAVGASLTSVYIPVFPSEEIFPAVYLAVTFSSFPAVKLIVMTGSGEVGNGRQNNQFDFSGDPDPPPDPGRVFGMFIYESLQ